MHSLPSMNWWEDGWEDLLSLRDANTDLDVPEEMLLEEVEYEEYND